MRVWRVGEVEGEQVEETITVEGNGVTSKCVLVDSRHPVSGRHSSQHLIVSRFITWTGTEPGSSQAPGTLSWSGTLRTGPVWELNMIS